MSSSSNNNSQDSVKHSDPIPIQSRRRSASLASSDSSGSPSSPPLPQTPFSNTTPPRVVQPNLSPSSSPILSYFMGQSPTKTTSTFPFSRKFGGGPPVFEEDETDTEPSVAKHLRRASTTATSRFNQPPPAPILPDPQHERGTALLRRLSLGNAFAKPPTGAPNERIPSPPRPAAPPNTAVSPGNGARLPLVNARGTRSKRSATLSVDGGGKPRREPSPMGERILKGHFDGFN